MVDVELRMEYGKISFPRIRFTNLLFPEDVSPVNTKYKQPGLHFSTNTFRDCPHDEIINNEEEVADRWSNLWFEKQFRTYDIAVNCYQSMKIEYADETNNKQLWMPSISPNISRRQIQGNNV